MRLFRTFILRYAAREPLRSFTTLLGIALGIAVIVAIRLANVSSVRGFQSAIEATSGKTSLEIYSPGSGLDEKRLLELGWLERYGEATPVIESDAWIRTAPDRGEAIRVLGVDVLRDWRFREYKLAQPGGGEPRPQDLLQLLIDQDSVVLARRLADRHGLKAGDTVEVATDDRIRRLRIRGLLASTGPARVLDGNFALMDIAAAQPAFASLGRLSRIDLLLRDNVPIGDAEAEIAARLPAGLAIQRPSRRGREVEKMMEAFQFNLSALSYVSLLVGLFLIHNTVSVSVISRRGEVGSLRALGASRGTILSLFLGEALFLAAAGCAAGLLLAKFLAHTAVALTGTTVSVLYRGIVTPPPPLSAGDAVLAFSVGIPLALLSAAAPALEASRVPPADATRGTDRLSTRYRLPWRYPGTALLLLLSGWGLSSLGPVGGLPIFGLFAALVLMLGGACLVPAVLYAIGLGARPALRRLFGVEGLLAYANLAGSIPRLSVSVAALASSLSMMVAVAVMVGSFRETVIYWVGQTLHADLYVSPGTRGSGLQAGISPELENRVALDPDVAAVDRLRRLEVPFQGSTIGIGAAEFRVLLEHGNLLFKEPRDGRQALRRAFASGEVVVSESLSLKHGLETGDTIDLPVPAGRAQLRIAGVYFDYSSDRGIALMDTAAFRRHFGDHRPSNLAVYLKPGSDAASVRARILEDAGGNHRVFISTNHGLRREILRIFDSTFAVTWALEAIAVAVAMLGVSSTLVTLVLERKQELAMLRLIGADRGQVTRMVILEAALLGAASQLVGLFIGYLLSLVLIFVVNVQSFGWTIQFHLPAGFLSQMSAAILIATALAGVYPARRACRCEPAEQIAEE